MITKKVLNPNRIRRIDGGFSFIPHRFLTDGFLSSLTPEEILLYFFLILASDRYGLSFYGYDVICSYLGLCVDEYIEARDGLLDKDLIAFDRDPVPDPGSAWKPRANPTGQIGACLCRQKTSLRDPRGYPAIPLGGSR